jgi:cytochrome c oxidase cbb3-type subunit 3
VDLRREPDQIYATISQGRPERHAVVRRHIPTQQIWQLVAYVQAMSARCRSDDGAGRNDDQMAALPESRQTRQVPVQTGHR